MDEVALVILAAIFLVPVLYVQVRLPRHTLNRERTWLVRTILALTGLGLGYLGVVYVEDAGSIAAVSAFVTGFGVAHTPAAFVLFIKYRRGEYGQG